MGICKASLDKIGKAAFAALSSDDKTKYLAASNIVLAITSGTPAGIVADATKIAATIGVELVTGAAIALASNMSGQKITSLNDALIVFKNYIADALAALVDKVKHELAGSLALMFGISENPGILGAIIEWVYQTFIKSKPVTA